MGLLWAAAWRAQAMHLIVFGVLPLLLAIGRIILMLVFLPFLLLSFGNRNLSPTTGVEHLRSPQCWVVLAPCAAAERTLFAFNRARATSPATGTADDSSLISMPAAFTWRHLWFVAWLLWFAFFLVRRKRRPDS